MKISKDFILEIVITVAIVIAVAAFVLHKTKKAKKDSSTLSGRGSNGRINKK